jgi:serine protease
MLRLPAVLALLLLPSTVLADRWIVHFRGHPGKARAAAAAHAPRHVFGLIPALVVEDADLPRVTSDPDVVLVEADGEARAFGQAIPYGVTMVNAPSVWPTTKGAGAVVAVLDTGVDFDHPDLAGRVIASQRFDGLAGAAFDGHGHGTHVAGTVAALDNEVGVVGVAPQVDLIVGKVLTDAGVGTWADVVAGIDWAVASGADVINLSLGSLEPPPTAVQGACDAAVAAGVIVVAAAGNSNTDAPHYPAVYPSVIAVGATGPLLQRASFSNFGAWVDLAAPGAEVLSLGNGFAASFVWESAVPQVSAVQDSAMGTVNAPILSCGLATGADAANSCPPMNGAIALIARGEVSISSKLTHAASRGAAGAILTNNVTGGFLASTGGVATTVVAATMSLEDGAALRARLLDGPVSGLLVVDASDYRHLSGTSMAAPHVAGAAALLVAARAAHGTSPAEVRAALEATAVRAPGLTGIGAGLVDVGAALVELTGACGLADLDGDGEGDACDPDDDGDGAADASDTCPLVANADQADADGDGLGDACDDSDGDGAADALDECPLDPANDADADGFCADLDDCPLTPNADQLDTDVDGAGDACDPDDDGDGVVDALDRCPLDAADACHADVDADGVDDAGDACPDTAAGAAVDGAGCSVPQRCPCATDGAGSRWKNHGAYVRCVEQAAATILPGHERDAEVAAAATSSCGMR